MNHPDDQEVQQLREQADQTRLAKLRALGREMDVRSQLSQAAAKAEQHLREFQHADQQRQALAAEFEVQKRVAAQRQHELIEELEQTRLEIENIRQQRDMVLNSRSWKITKPLRDLTALIERHPDQVASATPAAEEDPPVSPTSATSSEPPRLASPLESVTTSTEEAVQSEPALLLQQKPILPFEQRKASLYAGSFVIRGKDAWDEAGEQRLRELLSSDRRLNFSQASHPAISIIVVLYNKAQLTLLCLESVLQSAANDYELILIDNGSSDATDQVLQRVEGAKIIRNSENKGFGAACVQGAQTAAGEYLCFLNNDAMLCPGTSEAAVGNFQADRNVGVVGGKLLLSDGRLQEAGSMVWRDGTTWGYGRGDDPASRKYEFRRPVDYCSGALLFTPRALFNQLGGFDEQFLPAYYEDTDYCFKVWNHGLQVIYEPGVAAHHYESASQQTPEAATALIAEHRQKFVEKWSAQLAQQPAAGGAKIPYVRIAVRSGGARLIYMNVRVPHRRRGGELARANEFLCQLARRGCHVTCISTMQPLGADEYIDLPREIEVADARADAHYVFRELLSAYDAVWIAGAESMYEFVWRLRDMQGRVPVIIYEPVASEPSEEAFENQPEEARDLGVREVSEADVAFAQAADIVVVDSEQHRRHLLENGAARVELASPQTVEKILQEIAAANPAQST